MCGIMTPVTHARKEMPTAGTGRYAIWCHRGRGHLHGDHTNLGSKSFELSNSAGFLQAQQINRFPRPGRQVAGLTEWPWRGAWHPCARAQPPALQTFSVGTSFQTFHYHGYYLPADLTTPSPNPSLAKLGRQETGDLWGRAPGDQRPPETHSRDKPARVEWGPVQPSVKAQDGDGNWGGCGSHPGSPAQRLGVLGHPGVAL